MINGTESASKASKTRIQLELSTADAPLFSVISELSLLILASACNRAWPNIPRELFVMYCEDATFRCPPPDTDRTGRRLKIDLQHVDNLISPKPFE